MMDKLLQGVLQGEFPVGSAVQWMNGDNSVSPPPHLLPAKNQTAWQTEGPTPEGFKAFILNYVRDQAELILSAAEKKGSTSRGGTPQPSGSNTFGSGVPISRSKRTEAEHLRQLESVARRLDPGAVDETNFPSLGVVASSSNGNSAKPSSTTTTAAVGIAPKQMKRIVATPINSTTGGGNGGSGNVSNNYASSGNTPRRRIQPTQVAEVEVSTQFVTAQLSEPGGSLSNKLTAPATTSKLASRLGAMGLDDANDTGNPFLTTSSTTGTFSNQLLANRDVTPQKGATTSTLLGGGINNVSLKPTEFSTPLTNKLNFGDSPIPHSSAGAAAGAAASSPALGGGGGSGSVLTSPFVVPIAPKLLPLSASGHALAGLHAGILSFASDISLTTEVNLLLNLLAVPLTAQVDPALVACPELGVLLTCGAQSQQYAALVLQHAGGLLKGLGLQLLEEIATAAAATATALEEDREEDIEQNDKETEKLVLPSPREVMITFKETSSAAESALRSRQLRTEKAFNRVVPTTASRTSIAGGVGLHAFTADGVRSRSIEDQRRVSNREACRDLFFGLMRDASGRAAFFGRNSNQKPQIGGGGGGGVSGAGGGPVSVSLSLVSGADGRSHSGEPDGVVFGRIQVSASNLLRTLRPDNFSAFAELLTAAILQAAATGDALMDDELAKLAKRDGVSRFHSLNRRMQGSDSSGGGGGAGGGGGGGGTGAVGPRRGNPMALSRLSSSGSTSIGFGNNNATSGTNTTTTAVGQHLGGGDGNKKMPPTSPFKQNTNNKTQQRGSGGVNNSTNNTRYNNSTSQLSAGAQAAMDEAAALAARIMSEFPRSLSLYILFLEAADSHRLNAALTRVMTEKLKSLAKPQATSAAAAGQSLGEKVVAASALAGILGYLAFAKNNATAKPAPWDSSEEEESSKKGRKYDGSHPVDVAGALHASLGTSHILRTIPWVTRYLHFLKWDSEAVETPYFKSLLCTLGELKCAPELSPGGSGFGPAALCLRSLLDDFSTTVLPLPTTASSTPTSLSTLKENNNTSGGGGTAESVFGTALTSSDQLIDLRYVDLCCPVLAHARRLFASEGGVVLRSEPRRILPTAPLATTAAAAPPLLSTSRTAVEKPSPTSSPDTTSNAFKSSKSGFAAAPLRQQSGVSAAAGVLLATKRSSLNMTTSTNTTSRTSLDPVKLRLQQTFLQQYSQEDKLVKLKDVVEYCSDVIGCNAATATVAKLAPDAIKTASDELVALVTEYAAQNNTSFSTTSTSSIEQQQIDLERFSNAAAEKSTAATIKQVLNAAFEAAQDPIKRASTRAVVGLVSTELGDAVIATAAAMVAETAAEACSSRLPALVQKAIRQDDLAGHAKNAVKAIIKERKKLQQASSSTE